MLRLNHPARLALLVALLGFIGTELAAALDDNENVAVQVWAIRATRKNSVVSPELKSIADQLKKQFKYTGFKLEAQRSGTVGLGQTYSTSLIGGYSAKITPEKHDGKRVQLQVEILKGKERKLRATVTLSVGRFQFFGGQSLTGGDALIVGTAAR